MARRKRRKFSEEFKQEAVRLCQKGDRSIGDVAKELDLLGVPNPPQSPGRLGGAL